MFYVKGALVCLVVGLTCLIGFFVCLIRWGDLNLNRDVARVMGRISLWILGVHVEIVEGAERLEKPGPFIFAANHQSNFDGLTMGSIFPSRTLIIGKKELLFLPFFGLAFVAAGNFLIDRKNRARAIAGLEKATQRMKRERASLLVFPEGTRNKTGEGLLPFKKGAFHTAIASGVPIVPVVISPLAPIFHWKSRRLVRGTIRIRVLEPVPTVGLSIRQVDELSAKVRSQMLEALRGLSASEADVRP